MTGDGAGHELHPASRLPDPPGEVRVLVVHEQVLAQAPQLLPHAAADRAGAPAQAEDLGRGVEPVRPDQPVAVVAVAGGVHEVAGGVDEHLPLAARLGVGGNPRPPAPVQTREECLPAAGGAPATRQEDERRRRRQGRVPAGPQRGAQGVEEAGGGDGVVVEQDQDVLAQVRRTGVDPRAEAQVPLRLDHIQPRPAQGGGGAVRRGVVDRDEPVAAPQLGADGLAGPDGQVRPAPVDDDDADGRTGAGAAGSGRAGTGSAHRAAPSASEA